MPPQRACKTTSFPPNSLSLFFDPQLFSDPQQVLSHKPAQPGHSRSANLSIKSWVAQHVGFCANRESPRICPREGSGFESSASKLNQFNTSIFYDLHLIGSPRFFSKVTKYKTEFSPHFCAPPAFFQAPAPRVLAEPGLPRGAVVIRNERRRFFSPRDSIPQSPVSTTRGRQDPLCKSGWGDSPSSPRSPSDPHYRSHLPDDGLCSPAFLPPAPAVRVRCFAAPDSHVRESRRATRVSSKSCTVPNFLSRPDPLLGPRVGLKEPPFGVLPLPTHISAPSRCLRPIPSGK